MSAETDFTPKLGKIRSLGSKRGRKYLHRVLRAISLAGGPTRAKKSRFTGKRYGRGAGVGSVLAVRDSYAAFRQRRVIIKSRIIRIKGKGLNAARVHLLYVQRDGVTREGTPGELYDKERDGTDGKAFLERGSEDRHQFRFIVSAEDADQYEDLKPFVRRLMNQMEEDLDTKLDWVAVDHFNTGYPHTHIVLAGRDDKGKDLIIARDYMSQGMRERAAEIVSFDFGPRTDLEVEHRLKREVEQERFTSIDRGLLRDADEDGLAHPHRAGTTPFQQTLRAGRLQKLRRLGFAEELAPGTWRVSPDLEVQLRALGLRGDIIKTMHRELTEKHLPKPPSEYAIYDPSAANARQIVGRVVSRGLSDEINDRHYLIIDAADGFTHYVDIGLAEDHDPVREGNIVAIDPKSTDARAVDRTVVEVAAAHSGRYDVDIHLRHDPSATADFADTHVRRLEAIRRLTGGVERTPEGTWIIGPDHLERAGAFERARARTAPVIVQTLSRTSLEQQIGADGATWLDHQLVEPTATPLREGGFGREARKALDGRRLWLMEQGLAEETQGGVICRANLLAVLRRRELARVGAQLSEELGLRYMETPSGRRIEGVYRRPINLVSGRFAVIEGQGKEFSLVPWRPVLDRSLGKEVSGIARGEGISWAIGRSRGPSR